MLKQAKMVLFTRVVVLVRICLKFILRSSPPHKNIIKIVFGQPLKVTGVFLQSLAQQRVRTLEHYTESLPKGGTLEHSSVTS